MPCSKTEHLVREYFCDDLDAMLRAEIEQHAVNCPDCAAELRSLLQSRESLRNWQELPVPRWHRHAALFRRERGWAGQRWRPVWQWLPASACALMLGLMLLNTTVTWQQGAVEIRFGAAELAAVEQRLDDFHRLQSEERQQFADMLLRYEQLQAQDREARRAGYELLADRDYETVRSLQQLVGLIDDAGVVTW